MYSTPAVVWANFRKNIILSRIIFSPSMKYDRNQQNCHNPCKKKNFNQLTWIRIAQDNYVRRQPAWYSWSEVCSRPSSLTSVVDVCAFPFSHTKNWNTLAFLNSIPLENSQNPVGTTLLYCFYFILVLLLHTKAREIQNIEHLHFLHMFWWTLLSFCVHHHFIYDDYKIIHSEKTLDSGGT